MVLADSHEVSRAPCYSGNTTRGNNDFVYGTHTLYGTPLKMIRLSRCTHTTQPADRALMLPQPRPCNPCRVSHTDGLATSAFARHYSRNHCCFLFLRVLRCFSSPRLPPASYVFTDKQYTDVYWVPPFGNLRIKAYL